MKLVDILAKELSEWPEGVIGCDSITQDHCGTLNSTDSGSIPRYDKEAAMWSSVASSYLEDDQKRNIRVGLAEDYSTAIITKEMWQEARNTYLNVKESTVAVIKESLMIGQKYKLVDPDGREGIWWGPDDKDWIGEIVTVRAVYSNKNNTQFAAFEFENGRCDTVATVCLVPYKSPEDIQQETKQGHIKRIKEWLEYSGETLEHGFNMAYDAGYEEASK